MAAAPADGTLPSTAAALSDWPAHRRRSRHALYRLAKRGLDVIGAAIGLTITAPAWALIAGVIKLDSPGPILFEQERIGENGRRFVMIKFRSMHVNNDDSVHRAYTEKLICGGAPADTGGGTEYFKIRDDPRITAVGRLLRKTSLDELPQLLNVLRGEMSLVGPRPPLAYEVERYQPWQLRRLETRPGITGYWQVYGRSRVSFDAMVRMDLEYIERASLLLDLKLLLLTIPAVFFGYGAD
jgi:lipopolysaccharide/colanic/teichoic acid biosynthesis glycosyltransferase